jgi:predicted glycosyltransferase
VGAMELARAKELALSISNEILGKLYKEFRPDIFLLMEALPIGNRFLKKYIEVCTSK